MGIQTDERAWFEQAERVEVEVCADLWSAAPEETRRALALDHIRVGPAFVGVAPRADVPMYNRALGFGLSEPLAEDALDAMVAFLRAANAPRAFVQVVPGARAAGEAAGDGSGERGAERGGTSPIIAAWLEARGLRRFNRWIRLARDPKAPLPTALGVVGWRIEEIGPERAADFARIDASAFNQPQVFEAWSASLVGRPGWRTYLAFDGESPIACAATYVKDGVAWNGFAGTLEPYRGRGAQTALIARRLADAAEAGCRMVVLETAEDRPEKPAPSYRNQIRFGFRPLYAKDNWLLATVPTGAGDDAALAAPVRPAS